MLIQRTLRVAAGVAAVLLSAVAPASLRAGSYSQTNLVSDIPGLAAITDPNLVDPWGVSFSATSPFWISDNHTNVSTLYTGTPTITPLVVAVPGGPTGQVNNSNTSAFILGNNKAANFIFDTQAGTILAWNG
ncbi:MAG: TIGR03118 family protein, partial [Acidobacteriota bacterium]|nr:TIGR03118 family protein [Acidobacteriota bacterium]